MFNNAPSLSSIALHYFVLICHSPLAEGQAIPRASFPQVHEEQSKMRLNAKVFGYMAAREVAGKTPRALIVPVPTSMTPTRAFDSSSNGQHGLDVPRGRLRVSPRRVLVVGVALSWCVGETAVGIGHRCTEEQRELVHRESGTQ